MYLPGDCILIWVQSTTEITFGNDATSKNVFWVAIISSLVLGNFINLPAKRAIASETFLTILEIVDLSVPAKSAIDNKCPPVAYVLKHISS